MQVYLDQIQSENNFSSTSSHITGRYHFLSLSFYLTCKQKPNYIIQKKWLTKRNSKNYWVPTRRKVWDSYQSLQLANCKVKFFDLLYSYINGFLRRLPYPTGYISVCPRTKHSFEPYVRYFDNLHKVIQHTLKIKWHSAFTSRRSISNSFLP